METFAQVVDLHRTPDTYSRSTHHHNGGYLAALVDTVRDGCRQLPHYELARPHLVIASHRARSLDLEHVADRRRQAGLLEDFAERAFGPHEHLAWFELTAGSSSMLTAIVALALATRPDTSPNDIAAAVEAYILVATVSALLDNYVDCDDDAASGAHNYLSYYPDFDAGVARLGELVSQTMTAIGRLRYAERHLVIVAAMLAMYLTSDGARSRASSHTSTIANAGGTLTTVLLPILTTWRKINHEGSA
jgi:hypothetical protein